MLLNSSWSALMILNQDKIVGHIDPSHNIAFMSHLKRERDLEFKSIDHIQNK